MRPRLLPALGLALATGCAPVLSGPVLPPTPGAPVKVTPSTGRLQVVWHGRVATPALLAYAPRERSQPVWDAERRWIYVGDHQGVVHALDRLGQEQWRFHADGDIETGMLLHGDELFVVTAKGKVYGLDALTGKKRWVYVGESELATRPTWADGTLLVPSLANTLIALDAATGRFKWFHRGPAPGDLSIRGAAGVAVEGGRAITGFSDGTVLALKVDDGSTLWSRTFGGKGQFVDVDTTPVIFQGLVYVASYGQSLLALELATGKTVWQKPAIPGVIHLRRVGNMLVGLASNQAAGYRLVDGRQAWEVRFTGGVPSTPVVSGARVVFGTETGPLYALAAKDGHPETTFAPGTGITAGPARTDDGLWVWSNGGYLYRLAWR